MIAYRLCKSKYAGELSGRGAERNGGRWNSKGTQMLYTCSSRALCVVGIALHVPIGIVPLDYVLVTLDIPVDSIEVVRAADLPGDWNSFPHPDSTQKIGDRFVAAGKSLVLQVPSAAVAGEWNYLLNPRHRDFHLVRNVHVETFTFDDRMFRN